MKFSTIALLSLSLHPDVAATRANDADTVGNPRRRLGQPVTTPATHEGQQPNLHHHHYDSRDRQSRIVGGSQSQPGEFPYYVDIRGECGGSLIAPNVVLSAAHCGDFTGDTIIVGAVEAGKTSFGATEVQVVEQAKHPNYNGNTDENDVMVMRISPSIILSSSVELVLNNEYAVPSNGEDLTVLGLGELFDGGPSPDRLMDVVLQAVGVDQCNGPNSYDGEIFDDVMICAGVQGGGKNSCYGDSGGPLVKRIGNKHVQVGIDSWANSCALADYPGVFTRVSGVYDWITNVACNQWQAQGPLCGGDSGGGGGGGNDDVTGGDDSIGNDDGTGGDDNIGDDDGTDGVDNIGDDDGNGGDDNTGDDDENGGHDDNNNGDDDDNGGHDGNFDDDDNGGGDDDNARSCGSSLLDFEFTIRTDNYGSETSWEVVGNGNQAVVSGGNYEDDRIYVTKACLPQSCYQLEIMDDWGDGLSGGGRNPGYELKINDQTVVNAGGMDFGYSTTIGFGCGNDDATGGDNNIGNDDGTGGDDNIGNDDGTGGDDNIGDDGDNGGDDDNGGHDDNNNGDDDDGGGNDDFDDDDDDN